MSTLAVIAVLLGIVFFVSGGTRRKEEAIINCVLSLISLIVCLVLMHNDHYFLPFAAFSIAVIVAMGICLCKMYDFTTFIGIMNIGFWGVVFISYITDIFDILKNIIQWVIECHRWLLGGAIIIIALYKVFTSNVINSGEKKEKREKHVDDELKSTAYYDNMTQKHIKRSREQYQKKNMALSEERKNTSDESYRQNNESDFSKYNSKIQNILNNYALTSNNMIVLNVIHDIDKRYAHINENDPDAWMAYGDAVMDYPSDIHGKDICSVIYYAMGKYRISSILSNEKKYYHKFMYTSFDFISKSLEYDYDIQRIIHAVDDCNKLFDEKKSYLHTDDNLLNILANVNYTLSNHEKTDDSLKNIYATRSAYYREGMNH